MGGSLKFGGGVLLNCISLYPACILMYPDVSYMYSVISSGIHQDTSGYVGIQSPGYVVKCILKLPKFERPPPEPLYGKYLHTYTFFACSSHP